MMNAANDHATSTTPTVTKSSKVVQHRNIKAKDRKRQGTTYPGEVKVGQHADVTPGKSIRLHGLDTNRPVGAWPWELGRHDLTFKVGDQAVYDSYNLVYTGTITAIGAKTVTVTEGHSGARQHRLGIYDFNHYNNHFDAERIASRNADTMMCI